MSDTTKKALIPQERCKLCNGTGVVYETHEPWAIESLGCPDCLGTGRAGPVDVAAALDSHDALVVEVERLRAHRLAVAEATGTVYEADWMVSQPGPDDVVIGEIRRLQREPEALRARLAEWEALRGDVELCVAYAKLYCHGPEDTGAITRLLAHLNREALTPEPGTERRCSVCRGTGTVGTPGAPCRHCPSPHLNREADRG